MNKRSDKHNAQRKVERKTLWKWLSVGFMILIAVTGLGKQLVQKSKASEGVDESKAPKETVVYSTINSEVELKTTTQDAYAYSTTINQPQVQDELINQEITEWIDQEVTEFVLDVEKRRNKIDDQDYYGNLTIEAEVNEIADNIYIFELEATKANNRKEIKPFVVDLTINEILTVEDIFELELDYETSELFQEDIHSISEMKDYTNDYLSLLNTNDVVKPTSSFAMDEELQLAWEKNYELKELVLAEMKQNAEVSPYIFEDLSKKALANPKNWRVSIQPEAVRFYFDQYQVGTGAAGVIKVDLPMNKIQKHINIEIFERLGMDIPQEKLMLEPGGKYVALTFDDGPHKTLTPRVLDALKEYNAKATFFMGGHQAEYNPDIVKRMKDEGHELGDHTLNHVQLSKLSDEQIRNEISESSRRIEEAGEAPPTVMRPPYGDYDERVERITKEMDLPIIMWSVDTLDWKNRNPQAIINKTMPAVTPGGIVLMHDIHATTVDAVPQMLHLLENEGYEFVTVSQLINLWDNEETHVYFGGDAREMNIDHE